MCLTKSFSASPGAFRSARFKEVLIRLLTTFSAWKLNSRFQRHLIASIALLDWRCWVARHQNGRANRPLKGSKEELNTVRGDGSSIALAPL
jgi:hypothetical protein